MSYNTDNRRDNRMGRGTAVLILASILFLSAGLAALIFWQAESHHVPRAYVTGAILVVVGAGFWVLHLSVTDEYLREHFGGEQNAGRLRKLWRGGWIGVLLGAATIAAEYLLGAGR